MGVWLSEWLAPRVRRKTVARVRRALVCHGVVVCGWVGGSSVNKMYILVYTLRCMIFVTGSDIHGSQ